MSVHAMKPTFADREGYLQWRNEWKTVYADISTQIRTDKRKISNLQREPESREMASKIQKELVYKRVMARKMMTLLDEAKLRRDRILEMHRQLAEQNAQFPMTIEDCRNIDFHFNKGSNEFPFLPMWTLRTKGMTFYINHLEANIPWNTKETPNGSTRGMIRLKNGDITIDTTGTATINQKAIKPMLKVA